MTMITPNLKRLDGVDVSRGLAILLVLPNHVHIEPMNERLRRRLVRSSRTNKSYEQVVLTRAGADR